MRLNHLPATSILTLYSAPPPPSVSQLLPLKTQDENAHELMRALVVDFHFITCISTGFDTRPTVKQIDPRFEMLWCLGPLPP